jgi:poly(3-hydroxyalkanoate) synthetase
VAAISKPFELESWNFDTKNIRHMAFRKYYQNFILASSSIAMGILFMSKRNDHPVGLFYSVYCIYLHDNVIYV